MELLKFMVTDRRGRSFLADMFLIPTIIGLLVLHEAGWSWAFIAWMSLMFVSVRTFDTEEDR